MADLVNYTPNFGGAAAILQAAANVIAVAEKERMLRVAAWRTVERDGMPPCDGHTTYIGINSAGYACCFNAMRGGMCVMETAEGAYRQMSDLRDWRLLDRPQTPDGVDSSRGGEHG